MQAGPIVYLSGKPFVRSSTRLKEYDSNEIGCHDGGLVLHTLHYLIGSYSTANEEAACGDLGQDFLGGLSDLLRRECLANLLCQSADHDHGTGVL